MKVIFFVVYAFCALVFSGFSGDLQASVIPIQDESGMLSHLDRALDFNIEHYKETPAKIPQTAHFIWLGKKKPPEAFIKNLNDWIAKNPGWTFILWTDVLNSIACDDIEIRSVEDISFTRLASRYFGSNTLREKAELLRYEILWQYGGVSIDHQASCPYSLDDLHRSYELYCCLQSPYKPLIGRKVLRSSGVIGAIPMHPTVFKAMDLMDHDWNGSSIPSLTSALQEFCTSQDSLNIAILPPNYFFVEQGMSSLFVKYFYEHPWSKKIRGRSDFEELSSSVYMPTNTASIRPSIHFFAVCALSLIGSIMLSVIILKCRHRYLSRE